MPTLLACLSTGKGTWSEVSRLLQARHWTSVFLVTNQFGSENFTARQEGVNLIVVSFDADIITLTEEIRKQLKSKINDFEIALNLASGAGKEHMALLEAVLELGLNFRLVSLVNNQLEVLGMRR